MTYLWWPPVGLHFYPPVATGGPPVATTKWVTATMVATGGAAMGNAVATGGLPWVVSTGCFFVLSVAFSQRRGCFSFPAEQFS